MGLVLSIFNLCCAFSNCLAAPQVSIELLGLTTSNFPNIYRDGGGGGTIAGQQVIWFSDGIYTSGGAPNSSNQRNFTSNSIAYSDHEGAPITSLLDNGTSAKGPYQLIPYFYNAGEDDATTGIWPNNNIVTLCGGACGVGFPQVVNRTAIAAGKHGTLYNTGVEVTVAASGLAAARPVKSLFVAGEPMFGTFSVLRGIDGYLYMFAKVTKTVWSNGLKMARVGQAAWSNRSAYEYWNGTDWTNKIPAYDDGGVANILDFSQTAINGVNYGPGTGDVFWHSYYEVYMVLFQPDDAAIDANVYMSYTSDNDLAGSWSTPVAIYELPTFDDGYSYSLHAYPDYDCSQKVVPLSWTQFSETESYLTGMANATFF